MKKISQADHSTQAKNAPSNARKQK